MPDITTGQLAETLARSVIEVAYTRIGVDAKGPWAAGRPRHPEALAETIMEKATGRACPGCPACGAGTIPVTETQLATALESFFVKVLVAGDQTEVHEIADADETASALHATLSRMAALRDTPDPHDPADAPVPASALPGEDRETDLLTCACRALIALDDADAVQRIVDYLYERFLGGAR